jgi:hypothetical protein
VAVAFTGGRSAASWAEPLFWGGVLLAFAPVAFRVFMPGVSRREGIALCVVLSLTIYMIKVLHSPVTFTFFDEHLHWLNINTTLETQRLFTPNPLLPISTLYPGMQDLASAVISETGMSVFAGAVVLIGAARLLFVLSLYFLFEQITDVPRVARIGALIYLCSPNSLFWSAQFAYESVALPLGVFIIFAIAYRIQHDGSVLGLNLIIVLGLIAVTITHHLTSYAFGAFLVAWTLLQTLYNIISEFVFWYAGNISTGRLVRFAKKQLAELVGYFTGEASPRQSPGTGFVAPFIVIITLFWMVYVATITLDYLEEPVVNGFLELAQMIKGEATGRALFNSDTGDVAPLWERLTGFGAVGLVGAALPFGLYATWRYYRDRTLALIFILMGLAYPAFLVLRLTSSGWELANRSSTFLFLGVGLIIAAGIVKFPVPEFITFRSITIRLPRLPTWVLAFVFVGYTGVLLVGNTASSWPRWARIPGPFIVAADTRSMNQEGIAAAEWAADALGPDNRVFTDRINRGFMAVYGKQRTVTSIKDKVTGRFMFTEALDDEDIAELRNGRVQYIVVDRRLSESLPMIGVYFEGGEPDSGVHRAPISPAALAKFDTLPEISRVFDSGNLIIYDVRLLSDAL